LIVSGIPAWLADAVLYQIYLPSFADSNGDGIGDLPGVTARLDYLAWLGVDLLWLSPCFSSPFRDGGYDVSDHLSIAPRYGDTADLVELVEAARRRGIRVLLDLVVGHTSDQHPWFLAAAGDPGDHRYIWSAEPGPRFVAGPGRRGGFFLTNFLPCQPALNFGYARMDPAQPWRQPVDADGPRHNRQVVREIMRHWLSLGVSGFRCDMAYSLVKDDAGHVETSALWRELRGWVQARYPQAVLVAEWGQPAVSVPAGFHADFFLHFRGSALRSLWDNGSGVVRPGSAPVDAFFDADGRGSPEPFLAEWSAASERVTGTGYAILPTANHDFSRLACGPRTGGHLGPAFALQLTWPSLPAIYYGDEIGMRFLAQVPDVEGAALAEGNNRAGSRTPMQWDAGPDSGFSSADPGRWYLPVDPDPARPTVASQRERDGSLLRTVRDLIALRRAHPGLGTAGSVRVLHAGYPLTYLRGERYLVTVNPRAAAAGHELIGFDVGTPLMSRGAGIHHGRVHVDGHGYGIFQLR
jgi:glycosidase